MNEMNRNALKVILFGFAMFLIVLLLALGTT